MHTIFEKNTKEFCTKYEVQCIKPVFKCLHFRKPAASMFSI